MRIYKIADNEVIVQKNSLSINDKLNQRTTASFTVVEPDFEITKGMDVYIEQDGHVIFAGKVHKPRKNGDKIRYVSVSCVDFSQMIDKRVIAEVYENTLAGDIVKDFIDKVFSQEGISEGVIQDGPVMSKAVFPYISGNAAMNELCDQTGYFWEVDKDKKLNFFERATYNAPFGLTDNSGNYANLQVEEAADNYRNRQITRGPQAISTVQTREFKGDGKRQVFSVDLPIAKVPVVKVNGVAQTVGIRGLDKETAPIEPVTHTDTTKADFEAGDLDGVVATDDGVELVEEKGLEFDGVDDYVISTDNVVDVKGNKTLELWIKIPQTPSSTQVLFYGCDGTSDSLVVGIRNTGDILATSVSSNDYSKLSSNISAYSGDWMQIVVTKTNEQINDIYINGNKDTNPSTTGFVHNYNNALLLAARYRTGTIQSFAKAEYASVKVYDGILTDSQIKQNYDAGINGIEDESNLLLYYAFDEGSGSILYDKSGNCNGTINGATWFAEYEPQGTLIKEIDISTEAEVETTKIEWTATTPTDTSITVETALSLDGGETWGEWQTATSGSAISGITAETDLSNARLKYRATLETEDTSVTPILHSVTVSVYPRFIGWYWQKGDKEISQNTMSEPLSATDTLTIEYQGYYPIIIVAENPGEIEARKTIEGGSGIYENVAYESNLDTQEASLQYTEGLLERYGFIPDIVTFNTYDHGLKAGQLIPIQNTKHGLTGTYLIESVTCRDDDGLSLYSVKCLDGASVGGWERFYMELIKNSKKMVIRENEILVSLTTFRDDFPVPKMEDEMTYTLHQYHICGQIICGTDVII